MKQMPWPTKKLGKNLKWYMKDFLNKILQFKVLLTILVILTIFFLYLGVKNVIGLTDFWINLSAGFLTLIGTLFVVDVLLERQKKIKWQEAHNIAKLDLQLLSNMLVSHLCSPLGVNIFSIPSLLRSTIDWDKEDVIAQIQKLNCELLSEVKSNKPQQLLNNMRPENWRNLHLNLILLKSILIETIGLYKEILPPEILGKLLSVNNKFSSFYKMFSLVPDLFTQEENNWPPNKLGQEQNRKIRVDLMKSFECDLDSLFREIEKFIKILEDWTHDKYD